jgi:hypothetical protein
MLVNYHEYIMDQLTLEQQGFLPHWCIPSPLSKFTSQQAFAGISYVAKPKW